LLNREIGILTCPRGVKREKTDLLERIEKRRGLISLTKKSRGSTIELRNAKKVHGGAVLLRGLYGLLCS